MRPMWNFVLFVACTTCFVMNGVALAGLRVGITPVEVENYQYQRHSLFIRGELENVFAAIPGVEVVERARLDEMVKELAASNFSGLMDSAKAPQIGNMAGAQVLVTASLQKVDTQTKGATGFGISTRHTQTTASVRLRLYDIAKGTILYSSTTEGVASSFTTNFGGGSQDNDSAAIKKAVEGIASDPKLKAAISNLTKAADQAASESKVVVDVTSLPDHADIEVNGVYVGSTPSAVDVTAGVAITLRLSKAGYQAWERTIIPKSGLKVSPELEKKQQVNSDLGDGQR